MQMQKYFTLRKSSLVLLVWISIIGYIYSDKQIGVKAGVEFPIFPWSSYIRGLLGIERQENFLTKEGLSVSVNNWRLELMKEIRMKKIRVNDKHSHLNVYSLDVGLIFDFSPELSFRFHEPTGDVEIALSGGPFLGGAVDHFKWKDTEWTRGEFFGGVHFQPALKMELERLIVESIFILRFPWVWIPTWGEFPYSNLILSVGLKVEEKIYEIGVHLIERVRADILLDYGLFARIRF
jgi:hypothetical protein